MRRISKQQGSGRTLIFDGIRWPTAIESLPKAERLRLALYKAKGLAVPADFRIGIDFNHLPVAVNTGTGRSWTPEPVDATWRSFADLDLYSPRECAAFVRHRGEPFATIRRTPFHINIVEWPLLKRALLPGSLLWGEPDKNGISYPLDRPTGARLLFDDPYAVSMAKNLIVVPHPSGVGLAIKAPTLAAYLIARAALAIENPLPMRRCLHCGYWFEIRRILREPSFCSASCRALNHQLHKEATQHGIGTEEPHGEEDAAVAGSLGRTSSRRKDATANKKLRHSKGSARVRSASGGRGRATRRRRPRKA
jgi:hypothetical protein